MMKLNDQSQPPNSRRRAWAGLGKTALSAVAALALSSFSTAQAVVFFSDDFERTTLDETVGSVNHYIQNQQPMGQWEFYSKTRVWNAGPNQLEIDSNGTSSVSAHSGKYFLELDTNVNSSMSTKVNLVNGQGYKLRFHYRSRTQTTTQTSQQWQCTFIIFCKWVTVSTQVTSVVPGGGVRASVTSPGYNSGYGTVGDTADWSESSFPFTYSGPTGEATLTFEATGTSDGIGTFIDDIYLETNISGDLSQPAALTGILPPHVPGLLSNDKNRSDIVTPVVINKQAAIALGKALFWDQGIGSDGQACASCHFAAGGDNRVKNQMSPGLNHPAASGTTFEKTRSGNKSGPNYTMTKADFPFDPNVDDTMTSAGTFTGDFRSILDGSNDDDCARSPDPIFHVNGIGTRRVEPRNTPTTINAAFNHRNFWDGRANNEFNGVSPFGRRDTGAGVYINKAGVLVKKPLRLRNSSLASQAVGPVGSDFEMACRARQFADVGRKMLSRIPLRTQTIAGDDSVLSSLPSLIGATGTYAALVQKAFAPEYWNGNCGTSCGTPGAGVSPSAPYNQMEANFSLFFGLAVQMYEETLVSDDTRFDKWKRGLASASASEKNGESVFNSKGKCNSCHKGPTMSNASIFQTDENVIEGMLMRNNRYAIYDRGYYNLGVVPTDYDLGVGGKDPFGNPLSFSVQYVTDRFVDNFGVEPCKFEEDNGLCSDSSAFQRSLRSVAVNGAFKVPTLRNVELTGPYFHNGSKLTLEQVVAFYNQGGNFDNFDKHPDIEPLGLSAQEQADLVAFLKTFTDDRVAYDRAPFDHPSLVVAHGQVGDQNNVVGGNPLLSTLGKDEFKNIPAVGRSGSAQRLSTFEAGLADGTPPVTPGTPTQVNMAGTYNVMALGRDYAWVTNGGIDGSGYAYSANLVGSSISWSGVTFNLAGANTLNAKSGGTVSLPQGGYGRLLMLGTGVNGAQLNQAIVVTYTDNTTQTITQSFADWGNYQDFPNQGDSKAMSYRVNSVGWPTSFSGHLWGYNLALNSSKAVKSVTLPNNRNVVIMGMWLVR